MNEWQHQRFVMSKSESHTLSCRCPGPAIILCACLSQYWPVLRLYVTGKRTKMAKWRLFVEERQTTVVYLDLLKHVKNALTTDTSYRVVAAVPYTNGIIDFLVVCLHSLDSLTQSLTRVVPADIRRWRKSDCIPAEVVI
jgi:hypothetical protein